MGVACSGFDCNICYSLLFVRALVIGTTVGWAVVFQYMSEITIGLIVSMRIGVACMCDVCVYLRRQVDSVVGREPKSGRCGTAQRKTNGSWWDGSRSCFWGRSRITIKQGPSGEDGPCSFRERIAFYDPEIVGLR